MGPLRHMAHTVVKGLPHHKNNVQELVKKFLALQAYPFRVYHIWSYINFAAVEFNHAASNNPLPANIGYTIS